MTPSPLTPPLQSNTVEYLIVGPFPTNQELSTAREKDF